MDLLSYYVLWIHVFKLVHDNIEERRRQTHTKKEEVG